MGNPLASLLSTLLLLVSVLSFGQIHTAVSHPVVEVKDQEVHIFYDIINSGPNHRFNISVLITDTRGRELISRSLSGDVGDHISGGDKKHIVWNLEEDQLTLDGPIDVQILLEALPSAIPESSTQIQGQNDLEESDSLAGVDALSKNELLGAAGSPLKPKTYTRTSLVFKSLVLPGWGLTKLKKKPHWMKGLAAYGCIAGSVYLNRQAVNSYAQIDNFQDYQNKDDLYQKAIKQDNISEVLAITAAGIWVLDFVWTLLGTSELKAKNINSPGPGLSLITDIDPFTYAPMVGIHISF